MAMDSSSQCFTTHHCNVLALDGGGVRGLSSLLILQDLMRHINVRIGHQTRTDKTPDDKEPRDVFDFVTGTSTGGLIAIMLGKLGMTLTESIQAYHDLSQEIFARKHFRGKITHGLAPTKYHGSHLEGCIKGLIQRKGLSADIPMVSCDNSDSIACAVICREHVDKSKYSDIKPGAVPICTLQCEEQVACLVSQAARATSAAPTFFPVQKIGDRYFVDGGMEFNNPSHAIYSHYRRSNSVANSGRISSIPTAASITDRHQGLDFSRVRIVNLGTGTKSKELPPRQRDRLANLVPGFIRMSLFLKRTLTEFAVNAEIMADVMASLVDASTGNVKYERFSADNGVCYIKMDKYKELSHIEKLTSAYVKKEVIQARLKQLGEDIAKEYLSKHPSSAVTESAPPTGLTIPNLNAPSSQDTLSQIPAASVSGTSAEASMNTCYDLSDHDLQSDETLIKQAKDLNSSPQRISSPDMATRQQLSADMAAQRTETVPDSRALTAY